MTLKHFNTNEISPLVNELFFLSFDDDDVPFQSTILPVCNTFITYIYSEGQSAVYKENKTSLSGLMLTGQFYQSYEFMVKEKSHSYSITLQPTALHKLTNLNVYKIHNRNLPLQEFSRKLYELLNPLFIKYENDNQRLTKNFKQVISEIPLVSNKNINQIDLIIQLIHSKDGLLNTNELLAIYTHSQKTLETQFKKIVGLTPGRYIRLYRFLKLMKRYQSKEISLKDLIYIYDYYDHSHFNKDFRHFMRQSPKDYFKTDHILLKKYLKN